MTLFILPRNNNHVVIEEHINELKVSIAGCIKLNVMQAGLSAMILISHKLNQ